MSVRASPRERFHRLSHSPARPRYASTSSRWGTARVRRRGSSSRSTKRAFAVPGRNSTTRASTRKPATCTRRPLGLSRSSASRRISRTPSRSPRRLLRSSRGASTRAGTSASPRSFSARSSGCGRSAKATESEGGETAPSSHDRTATENDALLAHLHRFSYFPRPPSNSVKYPRWLRPAQRCDMADRPKPGAIVHVEFHVKEPKKVEKFYETLFGWKFQKVPGMNYSLFQAPSGPAGGIGGLQPVNWQPGLINYILVNPDDQHLQT